MQKVFISYSSKDEVVALRLYRDLSMQKISVWIASVDGERVGDFQKEFTRNINSCDYFIVIDSNNYRYRSNWCVTELKTCFNRIDKQEDVKIIVCLAEADGSWRNPMLSENSESRCLFERLNMMKYFNLHHRGLYDNERIYASCIESIYHILGKDACIWNIFPEEADLIDELNDAVRNSHNINDDERESLRNLLRTIVLRKKQQHNISNHIKQFIKDCEELGLNIFLPRWINVLWLVDVSNKHYWKCLQCLRSLVKDFPTESRALRGLGAIYAKFNMQRRAIECFKQVLAFIDNESNTNQLIRYEILYNLGQAYINCRAYKEAKTILEEALIMLGDGDVNVTLTENYYECLLHIGENSKAEKFIKEMAEQNPVIPDFQKSYGCYCMSNRKYFEALPYLKRAYCLKPHAEYAFAYLNCLFQCGEIDTYQDVLVKSRTAPILSDDDRFWSAKLKKLPSMKNTLY